MSIISAITMIVAGVLGASNIIVSKTPNAEKYIDKLTPYQGSIGIVLFIWGIIDTLRIVFGNYFIGPMHIASLVGLVTAATELLLGFLLGFGLITKYALSRNETALQKGRLIRAKLARYQGPLGIVAVVLGILFLMQ